MLEGTRLVKWEVVFTRQAQKDARKLAAAGLQAKTEHLLKALAKDPLQPPYEKLRGDLAGAYSRRINIQHRLIDEVFEGTHTVKMCFGCGRTMSDKLYEDALR